MSVMNGLARPTILDLLSDVASFSINFSCKVKGLLDPISRFNFPTYICGSSAEESCVLLVRIGMDTQTNKELGTSGIFSFFQ